MSSIKEYKEGMKTELNTTNQEADIMKQFTAQLDDIGDWGGMEEEAVRCWDKYVAPALENCYSRMETDTGEEGANYGYVAQSAWEQFCATDDDETFDELGVRVAQFVNGQ